MPNHLLYFAAFSYNDGLSTSFGHAAVTFGSCPDTAAPAPEQTVIPNLAAYVTINPNLEIFSAQPQLKRVVPVAVDRAIR
jgi:hypothetical protein